MYNLVLWPVVIDLTHLKGHLFIPHISFPLLFLAKNDGILHWLGHHLLTCPFKKATGLDCPGCGFQRSVLALLNGDFVHSLKLYPATIPIFVLLAFTILHLKFDFKHGAFLIKLLYISTATIVIFNYIYKVYYQQLI